MTASHGLRKVLASMRPLPSGGLSGRSASLATARARPFWRLPLQGDAAGCRQAVQALQSPEMGDLSPWL